MIRGGDAFVVFALWCWLTFGVGPWWLGVGIMAIGMLINLKASERPHA